MTVSNKFGRVDADNNVFVLELGSERKVGQYPNVTPEEALAFYERKFADLDAQVRILEQRVKNKVDAANLGKQASKLADDLVSPSAVGDLNNLRNRVAALAPAIAELGAAKAEANKEAVAAALAKRIELATAAEAIAKSPFRMAVSSKAVPMRPPCHTGQVMSVKASVSPTAVNMGPKKKSAACSVRTPSVCDSSCKRTSNTKAANASSAEGSAWTKLPPTVPRLRVCS